MENREEKMKSDFDQAAERNRSEAGKTSNAPQFVKEKKIFKRRSFSRQYRIFRQGGLGFFDSFFNALYITISEKSVEKEQKKLEEKGESVSSRHFLELHHPFLRVFSFLITKTHAVLSFLFPFGRKREQKRFRFRNLAAFKKSVPYALLFFLSVGIAVYIAVTLSFPIVLRAQIGDRVLGVVESKTTVDGAIRELENNVEFILGESFRFPYEVRYTFERQRSDAVTSKANISRQLYTYVEDFICTAAGLYVDDALVGICRDEKAVEEGISEFVSRRFSGKESGILNDIRIVTQAYPTDSVMTPTELSQLLEEMSKPLEERKKDPLPETELSAGLVLMPSLTEKEPTMLSDVSYFSGENADSNSNRPVSIDGIKLNLYNMEEVAYETEIDYETVYVESDAHYTSMADVTTKGIPGKARVRAKVYYVDGKEAKREIVEETVLKTPVSRVISIGTKILPEELGITSFEGAPGRFIVPHVGKVSSYFGAREGGNHQGWDIPGDEGENIYASASGTVVVAIGQDGAFSHRPNNHYTGYGYCVVIEHEGGYSTMYAHCNKINVTLGQKVKQGEKIAEIGNTGWSEGNHVHFEILRGTTALDPAEYLYSGTQTIYR